MADLTSLASSAAAIFAAPAAAIKQASGSTGSGFAAALAKVQTAVGVKPKTGFTSGPTYDAGTIAGRTKAAFNDSVNAAKAALDIKP